MSDDIRTGLGAEVLARAVEDHLFYLSGRHPSTASVNDVYLAVAQAVRDRLFARGAETIDSLLSDANAKRVAYLSAEFLMGPQLGANLLNLGIVLPMRDALRRLGFDLYAVLEQEEEPGLGNGGLGRLAACYLDSLATLAVPAVGYGIRYEFGIFDQEIRDGWQVEVSDKWLRWGNPWEVARPELAVEVGFGGRTEREATPDGGFRVRWIPAEVVRGVPHDMPVLGYRVGHCNTLRLWRAEAIESLDVAAFNMGDYLGAVDAKIRSETISKVLYPNDSSAQGKALRLKQQYFLVSSSLQDMLRFHTRWNQHPQDLPLRWAMQMNDTHPAIAVAELMRLLVDVHGLGWETAWEATVRISGYTNHTLLPEALETWSVDLFASLLPRHLEIIYEINRRHLEGVEKRWPGDDARKTELSIVQEGFPKRIRMAHLAVVGSHHVNGVAELHTRLIRANLFPGFNELWKGKFVNVTNGVTPRRWVRGCNPELGALCDEVAGKGWEADLGRLRKLDALADRPAFQDRFLAIKRANKVRLAARIKEVVGVEVSPDALFDVQIKRLHEYKRQHLNLLHILHLYRRILNEPNGQFTPRVCIFGAKAAPGYALAKHIIHAINRVAAVINSDERVRGLLKVVFLPDYRVSLAERIIPAADLSEQISTAGKEASGTGNMKLALNGAVTIGTLDGANVEIGEEVGDENIFIFGLQVEEVEKLWADGYDPHAVLAADPELAALLDWLRSDTFTPEQAGALSPVVDSLVEGGDPYLVLADFRSYVDAQARAEKAFLDRRRWAAMAIRNVARCAKFSSDRSIGDYAKLIWKTKPHPIPR